MWGIFLLVFFLLPILYLLFVCVRDGFLIGILTILGIYLIGLLCHYFDMKLNPYDLPRSSGFLTDMAILLISWITPIASVLALVIVLLK